MEHSARSPAKEKNLPSAKSPEATGLVTAKVTKVNLKRGILMNIGPKRNGSIHVTDVNDDFSKCSLKHFKEGDFLRLVLPYSPTLLTYLTHLPYSPTLLTYLTRLPYSPTLLAYLTRLPYSPTLLTYLTHLHYSPT